MAPTEDGDPPAKGPTRASEASDRAASERLRLLAGEIFGEGESADTAPIDDAETQGTSRVDQPKTLVQPQPWTDDPAPEAADADADAGAPDPGKRPLPGAEAAPTVIVPSAAGRFDRGDAAAAPRPQTVFGQALADRKPAAKPDAAPEDAGRAPLPPRTVFRPETPVFAPPAIGEDPRAAHADTDAGEADEDDTFWSDLLDDPPSQDWAWPGEEDPDAEGEAFIWDADGLRRDDAQTPPAALDEALFEPFEMLDDTVADPAAPLDRSGAEYGTDAPWPTAAPVPEPPSDPPRASTASANAPSPPRAAERDATLAAPPLDGPQSPPWTPEPKWADLSPDGAARPPLHPGQRGPGDQEPQKRPSDEADGTPSAQWTPERAPPRDDPLAQSASSPLSHPWQGTQADQKAPKRHGEEAGGTPSTHWTPEPDLATGDPLTEGAASPYWTPEPEAPTDDPMAEDAGSPPLRPWPGNQELQKPSRDGADGTPPPQWPPERAPQTADPSARGTENPPSHPVQMNPGDPKPQKPPHNQKIYKRKKNRKKKSGGGGKEGERDGGGGK